jgi:hypothetical protein
MSDDQMKVELLHYKVLKKMIADPLEVGFSKQSQSLMPVTILCLVIVPAMDSDVCVQHIFLAESGMSCSTLQR